MFKNKLQFGFRGLEASGFRDAVAERSRSTAFPRPLCLAFNMKTNSAHILRQIILTHIDYQ